MCSPQSCDVAIIGAGVVGLAIAERLLADGRDVVVIDPNPPGSGASYGNAGTIADYAVMPVGSPEVLRNLAQLLFDKASPLAIRRAALPALFPWLLRFTAQSLPAATRRNAHAIAALMAGAAGHWQDLALRLGAAAIVQKRGALYLYETRQAFQAAGTDMAFRRGLGVNVDLISAAEMAALEPGLPAVEGGAAFFPGALFLSDPGRMVQRLAEVVLAGAELVPARAERLTRGLDGVVIEGPMVEGRPMMAGGRLRLRAGRVIIAAGAHSRALALQAGDRVPLDTERGYHVEWDMAEPLLARPVCPTTRGFYMCPMAGRLRVAGTVELGGLHAPPSRHRIDVLTKGARTIFPQLGPPDRDWMGFRPSMPDSLPVIGPSRGGADVIHAYGHGHIGLTLAPVTARIVADLVAGRTPEVDIAPYRANRF